MVDIMGDPPPPSYDEAVKRPGMGGSTTTPYPPSQGPYPSSDGAYPPTQGPYPPSDGAYPPPGPHSPTQGPYPPSQGSYPPSGPNPPPQGSYPPADGTYPPHQTPYPPNAASGTDPPPTRDPSYPPPTGDPSYPPPIGDTYPPRGPNDGASLPFNPAYPPEICDPAYPPHPEVVVVQPLLPSVSSASLAPGERLRAKECGVGPEPTTDADDGCCFNDKDSETGCCMIRVSCSTLAHMGFLVGLIGLLISVVDRNYSDLMLGFGITMGVCYGLLWLETWCSHDLSYISKMKGLKEFKAYMAKMHAQRPEIGMSIECYHYETRYRTVYYKDSNGNTCSRQESYTVKVVTHKEAEKFEFTHFHETSPPNINLDGARATRVTFYHMWHFEDAFTKAVYDSQLQALQDRNRHRDKHMDTSQSYNLPHFQKRILAFMNPADRDCCFSPGIYCLLSCLVLTWPYRWWFKSKTGRANYTFDKSVGIARVFSGANMDQEMYNLVFSD